MITFPVYKFHEEFASKAGNLFVVIGERQMAYGKTLTVLQFNVQGDLALGTRAVVPGLIREISATFCREQAGPYGDSMPLDCVIEMLVFLWRAAPSVGRREYPFWGLHERLPKYAPLVLEIVKLKSEAPLYMEFLRGRGLTCC